MDFRAVSQGRSVIPTEHIGQPLLSRILNQNFLCGTGHAAGYGSRQEEPSPITFHAGQNFLKIQGNEMQNNEDLPYWYDNDCPAMSMADIFHQDDYN